MSFLYKINQSYQKLTDQDKQIISYLQNLSFPVKELTSQRLAEDCFVSRSSIFRLLKKLEIDSFAELKYILQNENQEFQQTMEKTNFSLVSKSFHTYISQIFEKAPFANIVKQIYKASVIYLYGTGNEQKLEVENFRHLFTSIGKTVVVIFDFGEYEYVKQHFTESDLFILFSYKGESHEGIEMLKDSSFYDVKSLVFTRTSQNTMAQLSDYQLYVPTESISTPTKLTYEISSTFYFIIDQLYLETLALMQEGEVK